MSEESRQIAEAVGSDRDRRAREVRLRAERRERIATELSAGMLAGTPTEDWGWFQNTGSCGLAIAIADDLMDALDARRDAEQEEAQP